MVLGYSKCLVTESSVEVFPRLEVHNEHRTVPLPMTFENKVRIRHQPVEYRLAVQ